MVLRYIIFLTLIFSFSTFAKSESSREEVNACLEQARLAFPRNVEIVVRCYNLALPLSDSLNVLERATYLKALVPYISSADSVRSYTALSLKLAHYFNSHIRADINLQTISNLSNTDLLEINEVVKTVQFYTNLTSIHPVALAELQLILRELELRKIVTEDHAHYVYQSLINYGKWDEAIVFLKFWPALESIPLPSLILDQSIGKDELGYYEVSSDLKTMTLKKADFSKGPKIVFHGDCHFAFDAFKVLDEAGLSPLMKDLGLVVGHMDFLEMDALRKEYPAFEIHRIHLRGAWIQQGFNLTSSPSFEFLLDGKSKYHFGGFEKYTLSNFCRGLKSINVELPPSCNL